MTQYHFLDESGDPGLEGQASSSSYFVLAIEFMVGLAMRPSELDIAGDVLIVDGATRAFLQALRIRLSQESRRLGRVRPFETIVSGKSHLHDGLQLADMIAGAVRQYVTGEETVYYRMFADKVVDLWRAPDRRQ